jgi:hypothetical protein
VKINKTSSGVSAQNSRQASEQIHTARKHPGRACQHIGERPTNMYAKADLDQYGQDDAERDLPCPWVWILPA